MMEDQMKKIAIFGISGLLFLFAAFKDIKAERQNKAYIGMDAGGCRIYEDVNGYRIGGELGFHVAKRLGLVLDFGYAFNTTVFKTNDGLDSSEYKVTYSSFPVSCAVVLITPVSEVFSVEIGAGLGYHFVRVNREGAVNGSNDGPSSYSYIDPYYSYGTGTEKIRGFAPHVRFAVEVEVTKRMSIYAGVKQIIGKGNLKEGRVGYGASGLSRSDVHFSGPEIKAGLRLYF